jgi:predicted metal-dependent HD superfamily phosphohydrolase
MIDWLKTEWYNLISVYCDASLIEELWTEIETKYTSKTRHYHNLLHIYNMLFQAENLKAEIQDLEAFKLAVWYHDSIYKSHKKDNEEKSAVLAEERLKSFGFNPKRVEIVVNLIVSTKKHQIILKENKDNAYLLDLDLSILGTDWKTYKRYITNIRKEYNRYPNFMYKPGRKKVLQHFLERETIYFTEPFQNKYEKQARENLKKEIALL